MYSFSYYIFYFTQPPKPTNEAVNFPPSTIGAGGGGGGGTGIGGGAGAGVGCTITVGKEGAGAGLPHFAHGGHFFLFFIKK
jgi:hypothetical protein